MVVVAYAYAWLKFGVSIAVMYLWPLLSGVVRTNSPFGVVIVTVAK
jgi:hypothetical protein